MRRLIDVLKGWRRTKNWCSWEEEVLRYVGGRIPDEDFRAAFENQIDRVYEVTRDRETGGLYAWPSWQSCTAFSSPIEVHTLARGEAMVRGARAEVEIQVVAGAIYRLRIRGQRLPTPSRIEIRDLRITCISMPTTVLVPRLSGWVKLLCDERAIAPGGMPLAPEELQRHARKFPGVPQDYLEFCTQCEGGRILPETADYAILGLADLTSVRRSGFTFVPLVDMRELGGLGFWVNPIPGPIVLFEGAEADPFAPTFKEAIEKIVKLEAD